MARARRQPPLFEFLGGPDRRAMPVPPAQAQQGQQAAAPEAPLRRPVEVPIRNGTGHAPVQSSDAPTSRAPAHKPRNWLFWGGFALAGVALLGLAVWNLAYRFGRLEEQAKLKAFVEPKPAPESSGGQAPPIAVLPATDPEIINPPQPEPEPKAAPAPNRASGPAIGVDPRKPGFNYLELATLTHRDAMQAVDFLSRNGVQAAIAPAQRGVDPAKAAANNAPHVLFLAEGVPSDRFKASERDRQKLEDRVEQLGKRFQRELKGPTDFSRPMWRLFRENKN